jgi:hydroxymethylpyrimidine pyrophosphatase-like HAD family hydrolase
LADYSSLTSMNMRAVATDLDGTLLPASKRISPRLVEIWKNLKRLGIPFFPVTGKSLVLTESIFDGLDMPLVCLDGAVIKHHGQVEWDAQSFIPPPIAAEILSLSGKTPLFMFDHDILYVREPVASLHYRHWGGPQGGDARIAPLAGVTHMIFLDATISALAALEEEIRARHDEALRCFLSARLFQGAYYLVILSPRLSKCRGTRRLLAEYSLDLPDLLFFGDWRNDVPLLKRAGFPVVMKNAGERVARYARAVTLYSNEEMGVERFLNAYFALGQRFS